MTPKNYLVTGSSGLIGSEAVRHFAGGGHRVVGIDNNMRAAFFGSGGDTDWNLRQLIETCPGFQCHAIDIRDRPRIFELFKEERFDVIIHCAAQPSHELAKDRPLDDFEVNAVGTVNLLDAARRFAADSPFVFMSTNKVYGDAPNEVPLEELSERYDYINPEDAQGINEHCRIDRTLHSLFGASKVAADIMTQEYGRYFGMPTVCFRGGCLTGPNHSGVQLHGFLSYLVKVATEDGTYHINGFKGKQVRDQIHSRDVVLAMEAFIGSPRPGEVYNLGGGRESNLSILEAIRKIEFRLGRKVKTEYRDQARLGDHICYISDLSKFKSHYPSWRLTRLIDDILAEMIDVELARRGNVQTQH